METKILSTSQIEEAADLIKKGELVAFPTETVYGLGADAQNEAAVKKVYQAKGRPSDNPLIVHVAELSQVAEFAGSLPPTFKKLAEVFWPGPLTMILPVCGLSKSVTGGLATCAFRMPDNQATLNLIKKSNRVLVGPSANTSGKPSPTTAQHVYHDLKGKIAAILDDGPTKVGVESTVIDLSNPQEIYILRPGAVTKEALEKVLGQKVFLDQHLVTEKEIPKAPGMKYKHYSPNAEVYLMPVAAKGKTWEKALTFFAGKKIGLLASEKVLEKFPNEKAYSLGSGLEADFNHGLFSGLRSLDETCEIILAETLPEKGVGLAYMNRLKKASGGKWFLEN